MLQRRDRSATAARLRGDVTKRVIAHLDCDAFYVSVELQRRPELRGQPVIVSGSGPRAVVTTASYEARVHGVGSAMSAAEARRRCPQAVVIPPDMAEYKRVSGELWAIAASKLPVLQRLGLDEAYADLSDHPRPIPLLRETIGEIKQETGIQISAGIAPNRLVAKIASDWGKPAGFVAIGREDAARRLAGATVRIVPGIGPKTAQGRAELGAPTLGQLQQLPEQVLVESFGPRHGHDLHRRAWLHDDSPVTTVREIKSRSTETTFDFDVDDLAELAHVVEGMARKLAAGLVRSGTLTRNVGIKVRLDNWTTTTRVRTLTAPTSDEQPIVEAALGLLRENTPQRPVRLIGVRVASLSKPGSERQAGGSDRAATQMALEV